jgi:hypothetical protein
MRAHKQRAILPWCQQSCWQAAAAQSGRDWQACLPSGTRWAQAIEDDTKNLALELTVPAAPDRALGAAIARAVTQS